MSTIMLPAGDVPVASIHSLRLGPSIPREALRSVEQHLHMHCSKWDTQSGNTQVLLEQALIMDRTQWELLCKWAEQLAAETCSMERELLEKPDLQEEIGVPRRLRKLLRRHVSFWNQQTAVRSLRFDFHPTRDGWRVSEVNSDVPGGFGEGAFLPALYQQFYPDLGLPQSPLRSWGDAMQSALEGRRVALLSAPGYLEDQQVARVLMRELADRGFYCELIQTPAALKWFHDRFVLARDPEYAIDGVVRFYQAEWLCRLPGHTGWENLLSGRQVLVTNPMVSVLSESKRFPLSWTKLSAPSQTWKTLMPECRDPREVADHEWEHWVLKAAYSNTGDEVLLSPAHSGRSGMDSGQWERAIRKARREPRSWVAQRRFETTTLDCARGALRPCLGVFVINGQAAGAYVRLAPQQVTDCFALEAPLLLESNPGEKE